MASGKSLGISIHAPAKGATSRISCHLKPVLFQSTLPRRERLHGRRHDQQRTYFNPRSREGSDWLSRCDGLYRRKFQSTLPRRERHVTELQNVTTMTFQSTLPRRERLSWSMFPTLYAKISIHAPAKGATRFFKTCYCTITNFNPRSREGSDTTATSAHRHRNRFQSTLPRRERQVATPQNKDIIGFQSTLPRRERRNDIQS